MKKIFILHLADKFLKKMELFLRMGQKLDNLSILLIHPNQTNLRILEQNLEKAFENLQLKSIPKVISHKQQYLAQEEIYSKPNNKWGIITDMRFNGSGTKEGLDFMQEIRNKGLIIPTIAYTGMPINNQDLKTFTKLGGISYHLIPKQESTIEIVQRAICQFNLYHQLLNAIKNKKSKPKIKVA